MNRSAWWPVFHDHSYAPAWREQVVVHWRANLLMLRSPRAVGCFCLLSGWPVCVLIAAWWLLGLLDDSNPALGRGPEGITILALTLLAFLLVQHVAFVTAMNRTYGPFVRRAILERGTPVCLRCGHLLAPGPASRRCGECGAPTAPLLEPRRDAPGIP